MYTLHIANKNYSSWSLRPWVMLKVAEIEFEEVLHPFKDVKQAGADGTANSAEFQTFSPAGKVPCLHDGDLVIWESLAILEYLAERHGGLWPQERHARSFARSLSAEMATGFLALRGECPMSVGVEVSLHRRSEALDRDLHRLDDAWQAGLSRFGGPYLAGGEFSIVDAMFCPVAWRIASYGLPLSDEALAYAERLRGLDAMRTWEAEALAETFRETGHDLEIAGLGQVIRDRRVSTGAP